MVEQSISTEKLCLYFSEDLYQLSYLHSKEPTAELINELRKIEFPFSLGIVLSSTDGKKAKERMKEGLLKLPHELSQSVLDVFAVDYADIYLSNTFGASPQESVWIDDDNLRLQEPTFQVRSFYKAHDLKVSDWRSRSDDHLVSELDFIAFLLEKGGTDNLRHAAQFLDEHLLRWAPKFCEVISRRSATVFFSALAQITSVYLEELRTFLEIISGHKRPSKAEIEAKMKPDRLISIGAPKFVPGAGPTI